MKLYIVPHSHIDVEWYWTAEDMEQMLPQLFYDTTLPVMEQDGALCFAQDQTVIWEMLLKNASEAQRKLITDKVAAGKFEPVGGLYVQPEVQEPCGESYIRNMQLGQKWMKTHLGRQARCAWHTDVFGQVDQLPQIFLQAGFDSFCFMRDINEKDDPETFPTEFRLEGPDGSRILTHWLRISYVLCERNDPDHRLIVATIGGEKPEEKELEYVFRQFLEKDSLQHKTGLALLPWGGDVYGLTLRADEIKEKLTDAAAAVGLSLKKEDIMIATPSEFFDALREKAELLPVKRCDLTPPKYRQDLRGTYLSRVGLKLKNRDAEQALLSYESLCACADKKADTEELWKQVLFGQFHDTIGGSCIDEVYAAAMERDTDAIRQAAARKHTILSRGDGKVLNIFNPTQFARTEAVTAASDVPLCFRTAAGEPVTAYYDSEEKTVTAMVSVLPYETVSLYAEAASSAEEKTVPAVLENEYYRLHIDPVSGDPDSIFDKQAERELLHGRGNAIEALPENDPDMEGALRLTGEIFTDDAPAEAITAAQTPLAITVTSEKSFRGFRLRKTVRLPRWEKRVEFETEILNFPGTDLILRAKFPLNMAVPESICETPFSAVRGREDLFCAQKWAGLQDGAYTAAIVNRGNCAYWAEGSHLSLGLLRSHSNFKDYAKYGTDRGLARFADGKTHTALAAERGDHVFTYALVGGVETVASLSSGALCFNAPLEAVWSGTPVQLTAPVQKVTGSFIITALAPVENGICLRGYHASEQAATCAISMAKPVKKAQVTDLLDRPVASARADGNTVSLQLKPFEIVTLHIQ